MQSKTSCAKRHEFLVGTLSDEQQEMLDMAFFEEMSHREISAST
jgi:hypothetical protein